MTCGFILPGVIIFLGSFLLFGIQPMTGKALLPVFGGNAGVWIVCLTTFQLLLPAGYFYAHGLASRLTRKRCILHGVLLLLAGGMTGFAPRYLLEKLPSLERYGEFGVFLAVLAMAGAGFLLLSANSSFVQAVLQSRTQTADVRRNIYRLYAVSNLGSLLGLLAYPFLFEPFIGMRQLWLLIGAGVGVYGILLTGWACRVKDAEQTPFCSESHDQKASSLRRTDFFWWFFLPGVSTALLNSVTAHLSTDISPVPLLWVVLLIAFLLSYVIGFSGLGERGKVLWCGLTLLMLAGCGWSFGIKGGEGFRSNLFFGTGIVFFGSVFLHSWLYSIRPSGIFLTRYYLCVAVGGATGGVLSGLAAPLVFSTIFEYPLMIAALAGLVGYWTFRGSSEFQTAASRDAQWLPFAFYGLAGLCLVFLLTGAVRGEKDVVFASRNFYGCLKISQTKAVSPMGDSIPGFALSHGETMHGQQFRVHYLKTKPTTYYGPLGGGLAVTCHPRYVAGDSMRVGVVGLGVGTMACWGRTNDIYRFYEINPAVIRIACDTNYFTYLSDSAAKIELIPGDARQQLRAEVKGRSELYDVLIIDAYSGDSIPYHLATREAFELYFSRLKPDGILALHVTNWHLDLGPLCKAAAKEKGLPIYGITSEGKNLCNAASWVLITKQAFRVNSFDVKMTDWRQVPEMTLPGDEKGSLLPLLRYGVAAPAKQIEFSFEQVP